jgi:adenylate cyclase
MARAELLGPDDGKVMWVRVFLLGKQDRCPELIPAAKRNIEAYPISSGSRLWLGWCLMVNGRAADTVPEIEHAIRVDPRSPHIWNRYLLMGYAFIFLGRYDDAVSWLQKSLSANPSNSALNRSTIYAALAAAQALAGHSEEARFSAAEASRLWPTVTARGNDHFILKNPVAGAQVARMIGGMRLAGIRDHADEDANFGVPPDNALHTDYEAPTPTAVPGARVIQTPELAKLVEQHEPLVLDTIRWGRSVPGAVGLWGAGVGGSLTDEYQDRLGRKILQLTHGDQTLPIVAMGFNSERYQGRNLALRLVALGYTNVYWYRGGREAWEVAGLPETEVTVQDW